MKPTTRTIRLRRAIEQIQRELDLMAAELDRLEGHAPAAKVVSAKPKRKRAKKAAKKAVKKTAKRTAKRVRKTAKKAARGRSR